MSAIRSKKKISKIEEEEEQEQEQEEQEQEENDGVLVHHSLPFTSCLGRQNSAMRWNVEPPACPFLLERLPPSPSKLTY